MLIERMIQLPQENSIPGIVCILLERKPLPAINFYESNYRNSAMGEAIAHAQTACRTLNYTFC